MKRRFKKKSFFSPEPEQLDLNFLLERVEILLPLTFENILLLQEENFNGVEQVNAGQRDHPPGRDISLEKPSAKGVMNSNILTLRSIEIRRLGVLSWRRNSLCHLGMDLFLRNAKSGFVRFEAYSSLCRGRKERKDFVRKKGNRFLRFFRPFSVLSVVKV